MDLLARRELVTLHFIPSTDPLDVFALRKNGQVPVAFTDTAITILHGEVPALLLGEIGVWEAKAHSTLVINSY